MHKYAEKVLENLRKRDGDQKEFLQAVEEVLGSITPALEAHPEYEENAILERMTEPERQIIFRVPWFDDKGNRRVNRGFRVQFNSAIGPYKGGLRFDPSVNLSIMKFLGFEQTFKNSLTTLPMGGGKGGADFDVMKCSDTEVMRFCQSFMTELSRHIGPDTDVPAGDIGVGAREVGYLFGQYKRLRNEFTGVLTGKDLTFGGSLIRPEATGFGASYFASHVIAKKGEEIKGKRVAISGFGNVAWGVALKMAQLGAKVVTISGPFETVVFEDGLTEEMAHFFYSIRNRSQIHLHEFVEKFPKAQLVEGKKPWGLVPCDVAMPCATQNELNLDDAKALVAAGCKYLVETSNMGCTAEAVTYANQTITFAPSKAVNAGGVAVSGLEMSQNSERLHWSAEEVGEKLSGIMLNIHDTCVKNGAKADGSIDYVAGANIGGFVKVADAMVKQGLV